MNDRRVDSDAQATVSDFLDYTEYLPSDLTRSLTLIGKLDNSYTSSANSVHDLLTVYGSLPNLPSKQRSDPPCLRQQISHSLDHAIKSRESSYAEAERLYNVVDRHYNRLTSIIAKLKALPKPPSRDPTPIPIEHSPEGTRSRKPIGAPQLPRTALRLDEARTASMSSRSYPSGVQKRLKSRNVTVPGEVLPPRNSGSPVVSDSEWDLAPLSPVPMASSRIGGPSRSRSLGLEKPKIPKSSKTIKLKTPRLPKAARPPRPPGVMGTNVHSAVAGISTSNALALLVAPPVDAKPGSEHAPWLRLTEWEMAKLRKKMKKNAIWSPSETMIRRELAMADRGPENYLAAQKRSAETGEEFIDAEDVAARPKDRPLVPGEISPDVLGTEVMALSNRGMKLNEAKKLKAQRDRSEREQATLAAAEAEAAKARRIEKRRLEKPRPLGEIGNTFNDLFSRPREELAQSSAAAAKQLIGTLRNQVKESPNLSYKKRKRDSSPKASVRPISTEMGSPGSLIEASPMSPTKTSPKKRKTDVLSPLSPKSNTVVTTTTKVPLAAPAISASMTTPSPPPPPAPPASETFAESARPTAAASRPRRSSPPAKITIPGPIRSSKSPTTPNRPLSSRADVHTRRASVNPPTSAGLERDHPRRKSATPAHTQPPTPVVTAASRRSKRPVPGAITATKDDGGPTLSVGKRKNAPQKKGTPAATAAAKKAAEGKENATKAQEEATRAEEEAAGDDIDPNEPRYCLCGDVSWGEMIGCDNDEVR